MTSARFLIAGLFVLVGLGGGAFFMSKALAPPAEPEKATVYPQPRPLEEFRLVAADGSAVTPQTLRDDWHLLFFGFANCPDICPITLNQLATARRRLAERQAPLPQILFVSVDPARDTPAVLAEYAARFGNGVSAATGSLEELGRLAAQLGIFFDPDPGSGDDYQVDHAAAVLVVNPDGELAAVFTPPHRVEQFVNDLPILMSSR